MSDALASAEPVATEAAELIERLAVFLERWKHEVDGDEFETAMRDLAALRTLPAGDAYRAALEEAAKTVEGRKALYPDSATSNAAFSAKLALSEAASSIRALTPEPTPTSAEVVSDVTGRPYHGDIDGDGWL